MATVKLTMAQALIKYLIAQHVQDGGDDVRLFPGVFAIFGHGNVAGLGEALYSVRDQLPTYRAHNEQGMAHAAIAYAKQYDRRRVMVCTTSIGPGATNMVTASALAHVNRLPVLFLPGDTFASRRPDPVLQQVERFDDGTVSANDCFRPVSRFFDRINRPEQILSSLPFAVSTLLDPAQCGPVTIALPQDVQAEAYNYPSSFFTKCTHTIRRQLADEREIELAAEIIRRAKRPLIIAGGGVKYSQAQVTLQRFSSQYGIPVAETQAGKGSMPHDHAHYVGGIGVTGSSSANELARSADVVLAIGTRLQDFTTGSWALFQDEKFHLIQLNVTAPDAQKHGSLAVVCDAVKGLEQLTNTLKDWSTDAEWTLQAEQSMRSWNSIVDAATSTGMNGDKKSQLPSDAQVIGAVNRSVESGDVVVAAAGGVPGELHKLWRCQRSTGYHVEYGYSCMGYEIAAGLGVKMATLDAEVFVIVGDGSYMMLNSELATSVMLGQKLIIVLLDNRGFACINRLQRSSGGDGFNNLLDDCLSIDTGVPEIDFVAHAASMGADAEKVNDLSGLEEALERARRNDKSYVVVIDTDPYETTEEGGTWWDVAIPEVSEQSSVRAAHRDYEQAKKLQRQVR